MAGPVFEVKGTTFLYSGASGATSFSGLTQLGMSDAEDVPSSEESLHQRIEHTNESGPDMPAKILHLGRTVKIRVALIKWDETQLLALKATVDSAAEGDMGKLGKDVPLFSFGITGSVAGSKAYVFPYCRPVDSVTLERWGLMAARAIVTFECFPNMAALSTAATKLYTPITVS